MKRKTKKAQRENVEYYLSELQGITTNKASDLLEMIEEAKGLKAMIIGECHRNPVLLKYYKGVCDVILQCYNDLPEQENATEKTTIEQAMEVLFGDTTKYKSNN